MYHRRALRDRPMTYRDTARGRRFSRLARPAIASGAIIAHDLMPARDVPMRSFIVRDPEGNLVQFFGSG
jgi:hypothetical protein